MYPGVGAFVLIRPAQTFYERIMLSLAPVSKMGLLCVEPVEMLTFGEGSYAYRSEPTWIECHRDDEAFKAFLGDVLTILDRPEPPESSSGCTWCQYRLEALQNLP